MNKLYEQFLKDFYNKKGCWQLDNEPNNGIYDPYVCAYATANEALGEQE